MLRFQLVPQALNLTMDRALTLLNLKVPALLVIPRGHLDKRLCFGRYAFNNAHKP